MYSLLLERPVALFLSWLVVQFVLVVIWSTRRGRASVRGAWIGVCALPILLGLSLLVVTPTERIIAACRHMARAVDEGAIAGIGEHLAPEFTAGGLDRGEFLKGLEQALSQVRIDHPRLRSFSVEFTGPTSAVAVFNATARVRAARMYGVVSSRWRLTFRYDVDTWLATRAESIAVPPLYVSDLRQWLR